MDIEANRQEQIETAKAILTLWDECPESGEPTEDQLDKMYLLAYRLAELVEASDVWLYQ